MPKITPSWTLSEWGVLMTDLYALDTKNRLYAGVDTYRQILLKMRYMAFFWGVAGIAGD